MALRPNLFVTVYTNTLYFLLTFVPKIFRRCFPYLYAGKVSDFGIMSLPPLVIGLKKEKYEGDIAPTILNPYCLGGRAFYSDEIILFPTARVLQY